MECCQTDCCINESGSRVAIFKALGEPTRLRMFEFLRSCCCPVAVEESGDVRTVSGPTVGEVCCQITGLDKITSTISEHLKELKDAGLITIERRGRNMVCGVNTNVLADLGGYFSHDLKPASNDSCSGAGCCADAKT
jgi:ArsR family transcriptional regulator